jgi:hypothetical protein
LTDRVIHDHLTGKLAAGVYPLLADETCWFLAADFDKTTCRTMCGHSFKPVPTDVPALRVSGDMPFCN